MHVVAPVLPIQGIPLCVLFGSPPALALRPLYSSARIEAREHNKDRGTGLEGEGGLYHGQCSMAVVVARTTGFPTADPGDETAVRFHQCNPFCCLLYVSWLSLSCLMGAPQTDRSMLGDSKEKVVAERDLLDVLWSYCMMEEAAGYVYVDILVHLSFHP